MKKFASFLLVICIIISLCPLAVFAQDEVSVDEFAAEAANNANSWRYTNGVPRDDLEEATPYMTIPSVTKPANATKIGIDVSEWQGTIDWEKAKADGVEFAILRVGYGMNDTAQDDKYFEYNADECERLGIPYGVYIYSYATSTSRASSEADHVLRLIEGRNLSFPVYYDMEDISTLEYNLASIATTFCNKISAAGYPVGIYANLNWWNNYLTASCFDNWHKWVAQFNNTCHYTGTYAMWQCSSSGTVNGISGRVDMNYLIGSPADHGTAIESYLRTNKNTYTYGEPILTTANSTHSDAWVAIYKADDIISGSGDSPSSFYWYYVRGNGAEYGRGDLSWTPGVAYNIISKDSVICSHRAINGSPIIGPLPVGTYKVALMYGDYTVESSKTITITDALYTDKTTYEIGESIFVTANSSVNGAWVGLYKNGETPGTGADCVSSILWYYTADLSNPVDITKSNSKIEHPRPDDFGAGSYTLHLFGDSGYNNIVASVDFTISTHTHTPAAAVEENRVEPTDSKEGSYDSVIYCSVCNEELSRTTITIPASGSSAPSLAIARISGNGRCETAIEAANVLKAKQGVEKFNAIILASGNTFADALPGSYLAAVKNAPILLHRDNRTVLNKEYILNNLAKDGIVYLLGGTSAIPASVGSELSSAGISVRRLAGSSRFETNLSILDACEFSGGKILVCTAYNFADSLSASATGLPILLVNPEWKELSEDQKTYLSGKPCEFIIIGGTSAVSPDLETSLAQLGSVERIAGSDRYDTSVKVAKKFFDSVDTVALAYGNNFPDGLCGGPLAYACKAPLILIAENHESFAKDYISANPVLRGYVLGGTGILSEQTVDIAFGK